MIRIALDLGWATLMRLDDQTGAETVDLHRRREVPRAPGDDVDRLRGVAEDLVLTIASAARHRESGGRALEPGATGELESIGRRRRREFVARLVDWRRFQLVEASPRAARMARRRLALLIVVVGHGPQR